MEKTQWNESVGGLTEFTTATLTEIAE